MEQEKFSEDSTEHFRIENEILKIKLKLQYGEAFQMENKAGFPTEIENQFLKDIIALESAYENVEYITVYEKIGKPPYKPVEELNHDEINAALKGILDLMQLEGIDLDFCDGPYDDPVIYKFITEELFAHNFEKAQRIGESYIFIYEEFHPNDKVEITENTHEFLNHWFRRAFNDYSTELAREFILADSRILSNAEVTGKMNDFFQTFREFKDDGYNIGNISFELQGNDRGMGFAEGMLKYNAVMDNGEIIHYEGPYKLYMQREDKWWSIFYFVMPGFNW